MRVFSYFFRVVEIFEIFRLVTSICDMLKSVNLKVSVLRETLAPILDLLSLYIVQPGYFLIFRNNLFFELKLFIQGTT